VSVETCRGKISINKHLKQLLRGTVVPITLIKHAQQDAEPQNNKFDRYSVSKRKTLVPGSVVPLRLSSYALWRAPYSKCKMFEWRGCKEGLAASYPSAAVNTVKTVCALRPCVSREVTVFVRVDAWYSEEGLESYPERTLTGRV
jgi:hypothetical protein